MNRRRYRKFKGSDYLIVVNIAGQILQVLYKGHKIEEYPISTSRYGIGNKKGSNQTPVGWHKITNKIGGRARFHSIFKNRRDTKRIAKANSKDAADVITTRILRLAGLEPGINKGRGIDSFKRCIYIHGTAQEHLVGKPVSHGCIRMKNHDIVELFALIPRGTFVNIKKR